MERKQPFSPSHLSWYVIGLGYASHQGPAPEVLAERGGQGKESAWLAVRYGQSRAWPAKSSDCKREKWFLPTCPSDLLQEELQLGTVVVTGFTLINWKWFLHSHYLSIYHRRWLKQKERIITKISLRIQMEPETKGR